MLILVGLHCTVQYLSFELGFDLGILSEKILMLK